MEISEVNVYSDDGLRKLEDLTVGEVFLNDFVSSGVLIIDGTTYRSKTRFDIMEPKDIQNFFGLEIQELDRKTLKELSVAFRENIKRLLNNGHTVCIGSLDSDKSKLRFVKTTMTTAAVVRSFREDL
jgi:hypothetical protein